MDATEQQARELFATELEADHRMFSARMVRSGQVSLGADYNAALRATRAALTPPDHGMKWSARAQNEIGAVAGAGRA